MVKCPYCLELTNPTINNNAYSCSRCNRLLPRDYIERKVPKASIGVIGFSGHGKTVFLTALFYLLRELLRNRVWEDFSWLCQNENALTFVYKRVEQLEQAELPESTPVNFSEPVLIQFHNIPNLGDFFLSFYDIAGGVYEDIERTRTIGRSIALSDVVFFIVSISDCGRNFPDEIQRLISIYINAVYDRLQIDLRKRQNLIVILSKADRLNNILTEGLNEYLQIGSYKWYRDIENSYNEKIKILKHKSKEIREWLERIGAGGFTNLAKRYFRSIEYTVISSTGAEPIDGRLPGDLTREDPKRILDPFLWVLEKTRRKGILERILEKFRE